MTQGLFWVSAAQRDTSLLSIGPSYTLLIGLSILPQLSLPGTVYFFAKGLDLGKAPDDGARLAWGELGRMYHGATPTGHAVIEAL